jgi:hypothetical protein
MSEKQTTFFTINCAENLESPNQCIAETVVSMQQYWFLVAVGRTTEKWVDILRN